MTPPGIAVIVNADDMGISGEVNECIQAHMRTGAVTSATLMANAPAFGDAVRIAADLPACSFGVHLNITEFRPLTRHPALEPLLHEDGTMNARIRDVRMTPALLQAIQAEWSAQVQRVVEHGVRISHLDSHHHAHTIPQLLPAFRGVMKRFGVRKARGTMTLYPGHEASLRLRAAKLLWLHAAKWWTSCTMPDHFTSLDVFRSLWDAGQVKHAGSIELMTHPGARNNESERALLCEGWLQSLHPRVRMVSYHELP